MIDRLLSNVAVVADNSTQPPVSPRTPSLLTQTTHPSCHGDRRCAILPHTPRANETRWTSGAPKCTVSKKNVDDALQSRGDG